MFNFQSKKSIVGVLTLSTTLALAGCESMSNSGSSNVDSRLTSGNQAEFFSKSGLTACAAGAAAGVGACLLSGTNNAALCSAVAAVAGCGILMGGNYYLEQQRTNYANKEERLNAYLKDLNKNTQEARTLANSAKTVLTQNQQTLTNLNRKLKDNSIQKDEAKRQLKEIDGNIAYLNEKLKKMKESERDWKEVAKKERGSGMNVAKLDSQIAQYQKQIAALEKQVAVVSQQRNALNVG